MQAIQNRVWPEKFLSILRCLDCQSKLKQEDDALVCLRCSRRYPIVKGVPRFVDQQFYTGSFGFQWLKHNKTQLDDENSRRSEKDFILRTRLTPEDAFRCFLQTEMDYLVLGPFLLDKKAQPAFAEKGDWRQDYQLD